MIIVQIIFSYKNLLLSQCLNPDYAVGLQRFTVCFKNSEGETPCSFLNEVEK